MSVFKDKTLLITGGTGSFGKAVLKGAEFQQENEAIKQLTDINWLTEKAHQFAALLQEGAIK